MKSNANTGIQDKGWFHNNTMNIYNIPEDYINKTDIEKFVQQATNELLDYMKQSTKDTSFDISKIKEIVEIKFGEFLIRNEQSLKKTFESYQQNIESFISPIKTDVEELIARTNIISNGSNALDKLCGRYEHDLASVMTDIENINSVLKKFNIDYSLDFSYGIKCLEKGNFDNAIDHFKESRKQVDLAAESNFGIALAQYQIQLIWDDYYDRLQPIVHDFKWRSFIDEENSFFNQALKLAKNDKRLCDKFNDIAKRIDQIYEKFDYYNEKQIDYDCFICTKVKHNGVETADCKWIKESGLIGKLKDEKSKIKPFFSDVDIDGSSDPDYESKILYALYKAKCFVLVCENEEYLKTPWVKNEYKRFCNKKLDAEQIIVVFNNNHISRAKYGLPMLNGGDIQDFDRSNANCTVDELVKWIVNRVHRVDSYVEPGVKYCPICGTEYFGKQTICNAGKGCDKTPLYTDLEYANKKLLDVKKELLDAKKELTLIKTKEKISQPEELQKVLQTRNNQLTNQIEKYEETINAKEKEKLDFERQINDLHKELQDKLHQLEIVQENNDKLQTLNVEKNKDVNNLKSTILDLNNKIHENEFQHKKAKEKYSQLEELQKVLQTRNYQLTNQIEKYEETINAKEKEKLDFERQINDLHKELQDKLHQLEIVQKEKSKQKQSYDLLRHKLWMLELDVDPIASTARALAMQAADIEYKEFVIDDDKRIIKYIGKSTRVVIPPYIKIIGKEAFRDRKKIDEIKIGGNVESIEADAFNGCGVRVVKVFDSCKLKTIESSAFFNCYNLIEMTIPISVTSIGVSAFYNCSNLNRVIYKGRKSQWEQIRKEKSGLSGKIIQCKFGEIIES